MNAMTTRYITTALVAPSARRSYLKANEYMKVAGMSVAIPGPPWVNTITRSKLLIAICDRMITELKNTGLKVGIMILL